MDDNFWELDDILWLRLAEEGKFDLIEKLQKAFNKVPGFETIVVTRKGFSRANRTHNMVLKCLRHHGVNVFDVMHEIGSLELAAASFHKCKD